MEQQPPVGQGPLIIEGARSHTQWARAPSLSRVHDHTHTHTHTHTYLVRLLWTSDRPNAETSTWQHTAFTRDRHPCIQRNCNPRSQKSTDCRPTP